MTTTNRKQRIKTVKIDSNIDETLKRFQKTMKKGEEIVDTTVAGEFLVIVLESTDLTSKNLLLG